MNINIIGAGIAGAVMAYRYKQEGYNPIVYERDRVMGACWECDEYQLYPHFFHTSYDDVVGLVQSLATIRPYKHFSSSYSRGEYVFFPPKEISAEVLDRRIAPYSFKMWQRIPSKQVFERIQPGNGYYFSNDKYEGVIDMQTLFKKLLEGIEIKKMNVDSKCKLKGKVVLTGALDEYFLYCYGQLPYRGMEVSHLKSEMRLPTTCVNFPDLDMPVIRMTDYGRLGYGNYIGIETPSSEVKHYPVYNKESEELYKKYQQLASKKKIILIGRLATYKYQDMDEIIKSCLDLPL